MRTARTTSAHKAITETCGMIRRAGRVAGHDEVIIDIEAWHKTYPEHRRITVDLFARIGVATGFDTRVSRDGAGVILACGEVAHVEAPKC